MINYLLRLPLLVRGTFLLILITLGAFFLGRCTAPQSTQDKGGVSTQVETKVDTLWVPQFIEVTKTIDKPTLKVVYKDRSVPQFQPDGSLTLKHRVYQDTLEVVKNLKVGYTAKVSGVLDTINLGIKDTRPLKIVEKTTTITNTQTIIKRPTGLYLGLQSTLVDNKQLTNYGPTLDLVRPKFSLGVGYDIKQAAPQFRIGINLIRDKAK